MKYLKHIRKFNESEENLNISDVSDSKIFPKEITLVGTNGPGKKITYELFILPKSYWKNEKPAYRVIKPKGLDDVYYYDDIDFENKKLNNY